VGSASTTICPRSDPAKTKVAVVLQRSTYIHYGPGHNHLTFTRFWIHAKLRLRRMTRTDTSYANINDEVSVHTHTNNASKERIDRCWTIYTYNANADPSPPNLRQKLCGPKEIIMYDTRYESKLRTSGYNVVHDIEHVPPPAIFTMSFLLLAICLFFFLQSLS
jgi:hypothetical protein